MQVPGLPGRTVPPPALAAIAGFAVVGCVMLVVAALSARGGRGTPVARGPTESPTRAPHTAVPTVIYTETPRPTPTPSQAPTEPPSPTPTDTEPAASPTASPTSTSTRRPATSVPRSSAPPTAFPPTAPPAATETPSSVSGGGSRGVSGQLSLCNPKPSYAAKSDSFEGERICVNELITNTTGQTVTYGVLGVQATNLSGGPNAFQTSWRGKLSVPPGGNGPTGGGWQDGLYLAAGTYRLSLSICYSDVTTCVNASGDWESLTPGITVEVVPWMP